MSFHATAWVQSEPRIKSQSDFCVMINLAGWANDHHYWAPSHATWAAASRCSVSTLRRTIDRMVAAGVIAVESRGTNRPNRYHILMPGVSLPELIIRDSEVKPNPQLRLLPVQIGQAAPGQNGQPSVQIEQAEACGQPQLPVHLGEQAQACGQPVLPVQFEQAAPSQNEQLPVHLGEQLPVHLVNNESSLQPVITSRYLSLAEIERNRAGLDVMRAALAEARRSTPVVDAPVAE